MQAGVLQAEGGRADRGVDQVGTAAQLRVGGDEGEATAAAVADLQPVAVAVGRDGAGRGAIGVQLPVGQPHVHLKGGVA